MIRRHAIAVIGLAAWMGGCRPASPPPVPNTYVPPASCAGCHAEIWRTYRQSGMGRSFSQFEAEATLADFRRRNTFYHPASDRHYRMYLRDGRAYMRRHQTGAGGKETNIVEKQFDYVMGSGYKVLTFIHRNAGGELIQLPVAWYTEHGGYWAMNPSYDRPDHEDFRRRIRYDCFFCHNAYPSISSDSFYGDAVYPEAVPNGIDCQRCHGPGQAHAAAASTGSKPEQVRAAIVNPARLDPVRRLEVCLQCHLQSTSRALPYAVQRIDRGVFSYRPGEPLGSYVTHFDHPAGKGYDDKFEIAHAGYRLLKSPCFAKSGGKLDCVSCHNPHQPLARGTAYDKVCTGCHAQLRPIAAHERKANCPACHMPQRRTEDVVHVVMTDHKIQKKPAGDPLVPRRELSETAETRYQGEVIAYYPPRGADEVASAIAQVRAGANLSAGISRVEALTSRRPEYFYELAEARWKAWNAAGAFAAYEQCIEARPDFLPCLRGYGMALSSAAQWPRGAEVLERALKISPRDARALHDLGLNLLGQGRFAEAAGRLRAAIAADPDVAETHNALASALYETGDTAGAEREFREAIRVQPDYAMARRNLAQLLAENSNSKR